MISEIKKREILAAFGAHLNRDSLEQIASYSLSDLRDAEAMLGDWNLNASYRIALRNRIAKLEDCSNQKQENDFPSWITAIGYILAASAIFGLIKIVFEFLLSLF